MMKSKLRNSKTRKIDDKNRSALGETIKIKKGFIQKTKESSKRNAARREKGHTSVKMQPREKRVLEFNPEQIEEEQEVVDIGTGKITRIRINLESMRRIEKDLLKYSY